MSSGIIGILQFAIDGITSQQNATSNNIANEATPGYTATEVNFEQSLSQALNSTGPQVAQVSTSPYAGVPATNGNNVDIGTEMVNAEQETLHYQAVSESLNAQFRLIQGATGGSYQ